MICGISFIVPNEYGFFLNKILKAINAEKYNWIVWQDIIEGGLKTDRFADIKRIDGAELLKLTQASPEYYTLSVNWTAYAKNKNLSFEYCENDAKYINNGREFIASNSDISLIIDGDVNYFIYIRDKTTIDALRKLAADNGYEDIEYIIDTNDPRDRL